MPLIDPFDNPPTQRKSPELSLIQNSGLIDPFDSPEAMSKSARQLDIESEQKQAWQRKKIEELPEIGEGGLLSGEDKVKVAALTPVLLSVTDNREMGDILSSQFDSIGITETKEGEILATNRNNNATVVLNKPGISKFDVLQSLGIAASFTPAGGLATAPLRVAGAIGTESVIQGAQKLAGGDFSGTDVALAGGLAAGAEVVLPAAKAGMQALRQGKQAKQLGAVKKELAEVSPALRQGTEAAEKTKIGLFEAQKTAVPARLEEQSFVGMLTPGAMVARKALLKQNKEAAKAVDDVLNIIAPPKTLETGAEGFRSAAQQAKQRLVTIRAEKASPIYKESFKDRSEISVSALRSHVDSVLDDFPAGGEVSNKFKKIAGFLSKDKKQNIQRLHNSKLEIDQMIDNPNIGATTQRKLLELKEDLLSVMEQSNPTYKTARLEFERLSPPVEDFQKSILGKVSDISDTQLKTVSSKIFDAAETNPQIISQAKKVINEVDPIAWRALLRVDLEKKLGIIRADLAEVAGGGSASIENVPAQLSRAIFGNEKQRRILYQGAPTDVAQNLKYLETALNRAKLGRPGGSQTATREEIKKRLRPGFVQSIRDFMSSPITTVAKAGEEKAFDRKARVLAEALYDTKWKPRMKKIRKMPQSSEASSRAMFQLLNDIEKEEEEN